MSIQERQNQSDSIARLASQRHLYNCAKRTRNIGIFLILLVAFLGVVSSAMDRPMMNQLVPLLIVIAWFVDQLVLKRIENALKTEAATIQEEFDCFVLDLPWPKHKGIQRITPERFRQLALKTSSKPSGCKGLADWYQPETIPRDPNQATIHCQKLNCWWDVDLRHTWKIILYVLSGILVTLILTLAIITGITVDKFIAIAASFIRVIAWGTAEIMNQQEAGRHAERIHRFLSRLANQEKIFPSEIRSAQDEIFEHRRTNSPVPDWLYKLRRDDQEKEAAES